MPTQRQYKLPVGESPSEFEDIVTDVLRKMWGDPEAKRYGRSGQNQHGIDILGRVHLLGTFLGQGVCQARASTTIDWTQAEASLVAMDRKFKPAQFVLATGAKRSTHDQERAAAISDDRHKAQKCRIVLLAWEDIAEVILADDKLLQRHYPQFVKEKTVIKKEGISPNAAAVIGLGALFIGGLLGANSARADDSDDYDYDDYD